MAIDFSRGIEVDFRRRRKMGQLFVDPAVAERGLEADVDVDIDERRFVRSAEAEEVLQVSRRSVGGRRRRRRSQFQGQRRQQGDQLETLAFKINIS